MTHLWDTWGVGECRFHLEGLWILSFHLWPISTDSWYCYFNFEIQLFPCQSSHSISACSEAWLMLLSKGQATSGFCTISALLPDLLDILRPRDSIKTADNLRRQEFQPRHLAKTTRDHMRGLRDKGKEIKNTTAKVLLNLKEPID